jgi:hypothetical protein
MRSTSGTTVHGLAGVMNGQCIDRLDLNAEGLEQAVRHAMSRMAVGLAAKL